MDQNVDVIAQLATWSQALVAIAQTGLSFANSPYDVERYEEVLKLAAQMTATLNPQLQLNPALTAQLEMAWNEVVPPLSFVHLPRPMYTTPHASHDPGYTQSQRHEVCAAHQAVRGTT